MTESLITLTLCHLNLGMLFVPPRRTHLPNVPGCPINKVSSVEMQVLKSGDNMRRVDSWSSIIVRIILEVGQ